MNAGLRALGVVSTQPDYDPPETYRCVECGELVGARYAEHYAITLKTCEREQCVAHRIARALDREEQYDACVERIARMINKPGVGPIDVAAINVELNKVLRLA
jgi:hypothetical protein